MQSANAVVSPQAVRSKSGKSASCLSSPLRRVFVRAITLAAITKITEYKKNLPAFITIDSKIQFDEYRSPTAKFSASPAQCARFQHADKFEHLRIQMAKSGKD